MNYFSNDNNSDNIEECGRLSFIFKMEWKYNS